MARTLAFVVLSVLVLSLPHASSAFSPRARPYSARVQSLLRNMTIEQKVGQMTQLDIGLFVPIIEPPYLIDENVVRRPTRR